MARIIIRDTHPIMYECENCGSEVKSANDEENIYPSLITYQCYSCGYISKPITEDYNCEILPIELRSRDGEGGANEAD